MGLESFLKENSFKTFENEMILNSRKETLILTLVGGHTYDSIYGYLPKDKILIAGDNLVTEMLPYFLHFDSNLSQTIECLKIWQNLDIKTIIPGHGRPTSSKDIFKILEYCERLKIHLKNAKEENLSLEQVMDLEKYPKYHLPDPNDWILKGIESMYSNDNI